MQEQLDRIESKVDRMATVLVGDEQFKQTGLIDDVNKNTHHRKRQGFFIGIASGIGFALAWLWHKIVDIF